MASGRMLRAQISLSPQVNDLSLKAALLFTWIIPHLDDFGRIYAHPRRIKAIVVPMMNDINVDEISSLLNEMLIQKLIILYTLEDELYLQFTKFDQHQSGLHKRTQSKIPSPEGAVLLDSGNFREFPGISGRFPPNRTGTEQEQELNLIKTFPEGKVMSGKPDVAPLKFQNFEFKNQAIEVLNFLNEKTGRAFRPVDTNLKMIVARLKSGITVLDCRKVIVRKTREWKDNEKMVEYLRPATLFNATKFEQYVGEVVPVEEN
jgi:uncharacterized phage protein (TIGR02220 family)